MVTLPLPGREVALLLVHQQQISPRAGWLAGWSTNTAVKGKSTVSLDHGGPIPAYDQAESLWMPTTTACDAGSPI